MSHWLSRVAQTAGFDNADRLIVPVDATDAVAWSTACRVCGVRSDELADAIAGVFRIEATNLGMVQPTATKLLPASVARKFGVFPVHDRDRYLVVATSNPTDLEAEQEVGFASGRTPSFVVADPFKIATAIDGAYSVGMAAASLLSSIGDDFSDFGDVHVEVNGAEAQEEISEEEILAAPVVRLANIVLHEAIARGASDIHIQPGAAGGVVRFRSDGVLHSGMKLPLPVMTRVVSRIKIMAELDITDRLRPQDGRARITVAGRQYDLRVSTVPTRHAEKAVIRILDPQATGTLDDSGIVEQELVRIRSALSNRDGIFIVTGPTGSGKTSTLYGALREISTEGVNIMTVEDPVEYELAGMTQIQVDQKQGVTFGSALRAILRQDPDVIFIGEIRDRETAEIAAQASLTGHLVLATMHTNDAVASIRRFLDLGLTAGTVGETLRATLSQRLMRRVCEHCAEPVGGSLTPREEALQAQFGRVPVMRAIGCERCSNQGYRGRFPVTEFFTASLDIVRLIVNGALPEDIQRQAVSDGMTTMLAMALDRVSAGETTLEEVERVIGGGDVSAEPVWATVEPVLAKVSEGAVAPPTARREATGTVDGQSHLSPDSPHILLVDDDPTIRSVARALLEKLGYQVSESVDGSEALVRLARGELFSLMVLDLEMPRLGGREVLRAVRQSLATAGLPVVVLTGTQDPDADIELLEQGADDYIRKPIDPPRFQSRIRAALRRVRA